MKLPASEREAAEAFEGLVRRLGTVAALYDLYLVGSEVSPRTGLTENPSTGMKSVHIFDDWPIYLMVSDHPEPETYKTHIKEILAGWLCEVLLAEDEVTESLLAFCSGQDHRYECRGHGLARKEIGEDFPTPERTHLVAMVRSRFGDLELEMME